MRSQVPLLLSGLIVILAASASAAPLDDATATIDQTVDDLGLQLQNNLAGHPDAAPASDASSSTGKAVTTVSAASAIFGPVGGITQGIIELGLHIIGGFFAGIAHGAATFSEAAATVTGAPVQSAGIAAATLGLLGLLSLTTVAAHRYGGLGAIPLFSRIAKSDLLENKLRADIFELIKANPGINVSEVSRRLDVAWGTATHHLQKLRQERLVAIRVVSHQKCYFQNGGSYTPQEMDVVSATKNDTARRIASFLVANGATNHGDLAVSLGLSPALVSFHLHKLVEAGVVARHKDGRRTILTPLATDLAPTPRPAVHTF